MQLRILGPLELVASRRSFKIGGPREHIVLATLALRADRVVSVDQLVNAVWDGSPPSTARGQIQGCISGLRKLLGDAGQPDGIQTRPTGYLLTLPEAALDSQTFTRLVSSARALASTGDGEQAAAMLREALDLWRGPALDGIQSDVVQRGAAVLEDARLAAIEERTRLDLELGRHVDVTTELRALIDEAPLRERFYGFLMLALYRSGRQVDALEVFRQARDTLIAELGIEPCQELRDLQLAVLSNDPSLDLAAAGAGSVARADPPASSPNQLPSSIADFTGREGHLARIRDILTADQRSDSPRYAVPIIAIAGPGGVGKSTLAVRAAHELSEAFPDGQLYVDHQSASGENRICTLLARLLHALGVPDSAIPDDRAERTQMYRSRLAGKRVLLVLDDVADEDDVLPLLPGSPTCALLATSRTRLAGLPGAHWIDIDAFDRETSLALLTKLVGAARVQAEPDAAAQVIAYCGGLPLALRIAGARLAARPQWRIADLARRLKDEVNRLDELSYRGLELRSSMNLGFWALSEGAKRLFCLLALPEAPTLPGWVAAVLLETGLGQAERLAEVLVDAQLLEPVHNPDGMAGYRFHDLVRVYARERLTETTTDAERHDALSRVLGAWLALAETAHRKEYGGDYTILHGSAPRWSLPDGVDGDLLSDPMSWLDTERAGLVAAVRQAAEAGMDELCWDLALTAVSLFEVKGHVDDWQETTELAYEVCLLAGNRTGCAAMLYSLGTLHVAQKRTYDAERAFDDAFTIFQSEGNTHGQALVLRNSALVDRMLGNYDAMWTKYLDALAKMRTVGDLIGQANILRSMAKFRMDEGDLDEAQQMLGEALELCQSAGYLRGEAQVISRFGELHMRTGQTARARQALNEVLKTVRRIGDRVGEAHALYGLGIVRTREGKLDSAQTTLANALATAVQAGDRAIEGQARYALGEIALARGETAASAVHLTRAQQTFGELGSSLWQAKTFILLSEVAESEVDGGGSDRYLEQARSLLSAMDSKEASRLRRQIEGGAGVRTGGDDLSLGS